MCRGPVSPRALPTRSTDVVGARQSVTSCRCDFPFTCSTQQVVTAHDHSSQPPNVSGPRPDPPSEQLPAAPGCAPADTRPPHWRVPNAIAREAALTQPGFTPPAPRRGSHLCVCWYSGSIAPAPPGPALASPNHVLTALLPASGRRTLQPRRLELPPHSPSWWWLREKEGERPKRPGEGG